MAWPPDVWRTMPWPELWARVDRMRDRTVKDESEQRWQQAIARTRASNQRRRGAHSGGRSSR
jgi:hypothetical protein